MPNQLLGRARRAADIAANTSLAEDPELQLEEEAQERPWSEDERKDFIDKFLLYPKVPCALLWVGC